MIPPVKNSVSAELNVELPRTPALKGPLEVETVDVRRVDQNIAIDMGVGNSNWKADVCVGHASAIPE